MKDEHKSKQQLIDELKQLRQSINSETRINTENLLQESAEVADIGYAIWDDINTKYDFVSEKYAQIAGCSVEDYIDNYCDIEGDMMLLHPDDRDRYQAFEKSDWINDPKSKGTGNIEYRIIRKDGKIRHILEYFKCIYNESGQHVRSLITNQDITKHKLLEKKFEELEKQSSMWLMYSPVCTEIIDSDFNLQYMSKAGIDALQIEDVSQFYGKPYPPEFYPDSYKIPMKVNLQSVVKTGEIISQDAYLFDTENQKKYFHSTLVPVLDENGKLDYIMVVSIDITEQKKNEQQLQRSQKLEALGKLTGGIAHDFNNILGIIIGYSQLLKNKSNNNPDFMKYIEQILNAGERGSNLTKKLLSFTSKQATRADKTNIKSLLEAHRDMLQKTLTVRVQLCYELEEVWPVFIDKNQLEDSILNICINAMHAMAETSGAKLTIRLCNQTIGTIDGKALGLEAGDYVQLCFTDTGSGMNEITKAQIFDPFFTTKGENGTGLGLSQVFGFVERSGGTVTVISKLTHGSQFTLYFPRNLNTNYSNKDLIGEDTILHGNESILVVDDEQALLELASEILVDNGYKTLTATSGIEALKILDTEQVDLILSDILMPDMNGYQLAACAMEQYPDLKIQLISGFTDETSIRSIDEKFHQNLIYKPYNSVELLTNIRALLDS